MGYRSTFTTLVTDPVASSGRSLPDWFVEKWKGKVHFGENGTLPLSAKWEGKVYSLGPGFEGWSELPADLQKALDWKRIKSGPFVIVWLHQDGQVTRTLITENEIRHEQAYEWDETLDADSPLPAGHS